VAARRLRDLEAGRSRSAEHLKPAPAVRPLGTLLLALGVLLGVAVGAGLLLGVQLPGLSRLVAVGLAKLTLIASGGLMAGGAVLHRLAKRAEERDRLLNR
jgi:hypothetical protein